MLFRVIGWLGHRLAADKKVILVSLLAGALFTAAMGMATKSYAESVQADIAGQVIRFHVRANSNEPEDQALKLAVRDRILEEMGNELESTENIEETREILFLNMDGIEKAAQDEARRRGFDYSVRVGLGTTFFPTKRYADITLPAGRYEALCVEIGAAGGENWWCVMYPPLCYVDVTQAEAPEKTKEPLRSGLSADEYRIVTLGGSASETTVKNADVKVKFKIVEWWQNRKAKDTVQVASKLR